MTQPWAHYARYNRLANETLYEACGGLSDAEYRRDLGAILHESFDALRQARATMDQRIDRFFSNLPEGFERRTVCYVNNAGIESDDPLDVILPHFFNHQTHHRAQVHTLLSQLGRDPPVLDLHRVLRPNPP